MKDSSFDKELIAANPHSEKTNSFVTNTMRKIRIERLKVEPEPRKMFWERFAIAHKLTFASLAIGVLSVVGFSGYAYAIGSDPFSLIRRWVDGNTVKVEYDGRKFEYGKTRNYSDAAITAYAELSTVQGIDFAAQHAFEVPKDGVEYLSPPPNMVDYSDPVAGQPRLGTITEITDSTVTMHVQYSLGDKMTPSRDRDETVTMPRADLQFFAKGAKTDVGGSKGALIELRDVQYLKHAQGSQIKPTLTTVYFGYALSHSLNDFKEADKATADGTGAKNDETRGIFETNFGGLTDRCVNNGAETCSERYYKGEGQGLYNIEKHGEKIYNSMNAQSITYAATAQIPDVIDRGLEGKIVAISDTHITVQGSSGAQWKLAYSTKEREAFKRNWGSELKKGDTIGVRLLQSINDLDNRTIDTQHIEAMQRY